MILPTKHLRLRASLLAAGGLVLKLLDRPATLSEVWAHLEDDPTVGSFRNLVLAIDFLYTIGAVELDKNGLLRRCS